MRKSKLLFSLFLVIISLVGCNKIEKIETETAAQNEETSQ